MHVTCRSPRLYPCDHKPPGLISKLCWVFPDKKSHQSLSRAYALLPICDFSLLYPITLGLLGNTKWQNPERQSCRISLSWICHSSGALSLPSPWESSSSSDNWKTRWVGLMKNRKKHSDFQTWYDLIYFSMTIIRDSFRTGGEHFRVAIGLGCPVNWSIVHGEVYGIVCRERIESYWYSRSFSHWEGASCKEKEDKSCQKYVSFYI